VETVTNYQYVGSKYFQSEGSKTLVSFTADAADILRWGGVPAKNERFHGGFQRALSARYRKIISYFDKGQISPGAIVVAFRPGALGITDLGYPKGWPDVSSISTAPQFVHLDFESDSFDETPLDELIVRVRLLLEGRPGFAIAAQLVNEDQDGKQSELTDEIPDVDDPDNEGDGDDLDVGQSKLRAFYDFIGNPAEIEKWLSAERSQIEEIRKKKAQTQAEREYCAYSPEEKIRSTLVSLLRPAMIVDGQHRVNGAAESEKDSIRFTVCAIADADWVEQVFQFVVLNKMAKPISKDFLTELLNTSLTNEEVDDIDKRLETIGIKNSDRRIHKYINHDPRSPFAGTVAEAGEVAGADKAGKLSQQGMLTLAKRWRSIAAGGKTSEINCFVRYLGASNLSEARQAWQDYEKWMSLFFAFWSEVRSLYEPQQVWMKQEKYHLLYIVTLQALQDLFIESKASAKVKFQSIDDFRIQVREFFADVPGGFFLNWSQSGLQSGNGWSLIKKAIEMFQNGAKLPKVQKESELFGKN